LGTSACGAGRFRRSTRALLVIVIPACVAGYTAATMTPKRRIGTGRGIECAIPDHRRAVVIDGDTIDVKLVCAFA
jgi:hypothetical protein